MRVAFRGLLAVRYTAGMKRTSVSPSAEAVAVNSCWRIFNAWCKAPVPQSPEERRQSREERGPRVCYMLLITFLSIGKEDVES